MEHECVTGMTRSGKSYYAARLGRRHAGPLLVIDPQDTPGWPWPRATGANVAADVIDQARNGGVVYVPDWNDKHGRAEVTYLLAEVMEYAKAHGAGAGRGNHAWLVICDEAHIYAPEGGPPGGLHLLARRGLRWGVSAMFVSQRPADVAKAVISQAARHVIFEPGPFGGPYFEKYGIPADEVRRLLDEGRQKYAGKAAGGAGPWPFLVWESGRLAGPNHL